MIFSSIILVYKKIVTRNFIEVFFFIAQVVAPIFVFFCTHVQTNTSFFKKKSVPKSVDILIIAKSGIPIPPEISAKVFIFVLIFLSFFLVL